MPKSGFKSITVSDTIYDKLYASYEAKKDTLSMKGIASFSGFIISQLSEILQKENEK